MSRTQRDSEYQVIDRIVGTRGLNMSSPAGAGISFQPRKGGEPETSERADSSCTLYAESDPMNDCAAMLVT